jgi:ABC-2 type transport system ATP-binding protein
MIEIRDLTKRFGKRVAVDRMVLRVEAGRIYGLLGHNGAGKSTTIGMLLGHLFPDEGSTWIDGVCVQENRFAAIRHVGAIFEAPAFYGYLSGYRNLRILSEYSGGVEERAIGEAVELTGLTSRIQDRVETYSHGMRQRLALAQALLPRPKVLILDEPADGLDPEGIREMRELIQRLNRDLGLTILLSSHLLGEVDQVCHEVGIMREGRLLFTGDWRRGRSPKRRRVEVSDAAAAERLLGEARIGREPQREGNSVSFFVAGDEEAAAAVALLVKNGISIFALEAEEVTLEEFYLGILRGDRDSAGVGR